MNPNLRVSLVCAGIVGVFLIVFGAVNGWF